MLELVNQLLDLSKIEAGKMQLECGSFALDALLAGITSVFGARARMKGLGFEMSPADDVPQTVVGDELRLRQILVNLVGNAVKFTRQGRVGVQVEVERMRSDRVELLFRIVDTGIGIPPAKLPQVFDSFTQVDGSTTRAFGGSGLGTSISKRLVELMDGQIGAESTPGEGTTFWFTAVFGIADEATQVVALAVLCHNSVRRLEAGELVTPQDGQGVSGVTISGEKEGERNGQPAGAHTAPLGSELIPSLRPQAARRSYRSWRPPTFRKLHDHTRPGRLHGPRLRTVLLEREVRSRPVVVAEVLAEDSLQVLLPQHDDVVEALATDRPDQSL